MKNKLLKIAVIISLIAICIILLMPNSFARISPDKITGKPSSIPDINMKSFSDKLMIAIRTIGIFIAVGAMMIIGIKYITGSLEEKANYKKSMMPYLIGCILLFGASTIAPEIIETFKVNQNVENVGNLILGIIQVVGTFVAVAILMILGIKYMLGSVEQRASYKKSMLPYIIGAILLFGGVNITTAIYENFALDEETHTSGLYERDEDGNPICRNCGDPLGVREQKQGVCSNCGEPTGI